MSHYRGFERSQCLRQSLCDKDDVSKNDFASARGSVLKECALEGKIDSTGGMGKRVARFSRFRLLCPRDRFPQARRRIFFSAFLIFR